MQDRLITCNITEVQPLKIHGRTIVSTDAIPLFWTGSGLEFQYCGSELWIEVEADYDMFEPWLACTLNGELISRQQVYKGKQWICLIRNMNPEISKNIHVTRETQAMSEDLKLYLQITRISYDGHFLPIKERRCRLEFIGDSITSGEGTFGAKEDQDWVPAFFSSTHNYASLAAKAMDADYQILSQSGWGILSSWDNNPNCAIPDYYEQICGLVKGDVHKKLGAHCAFDFSSYPADIVVVNLGTNDASAFEQPAFTDPETGIQYEQRKTSDGSYHKDDLKKLQNGVISFLTKIRKNRPEAYIIWVNGMLGAPLFSYLQEAINQYQNQSQDAKVALIRLPEATEETIGSRSHPGFLNHKEAAETLQKIMIRILDMNKQD